MATIQSSREDVIYDGQALENYEDGHCWIVALDDWQLSVVLSSVRYAHWRARWRTLGGYSWQELREKIAYLEHCLMAGCNVQELITTQRLLIGAITGTVVDLDEPLPLEGTVDFSQSGLATKFLSTEENPRNITDILVKTQTELESGLEEINTTIGELELTATCSPDVNVSCGGGGSGGGGTYYLGPDGEHGYYHLPIDPDARDDALTPPLEDPQTGTPPDGFATWDEYNIYKCKAARVYADFIIQIYRVVLGVDDFYVYVNTFAAGFLLPVAVGYITAFFAVTVASALVTALAATGAVVLLASLLVVYVGVLIAEHNHMVAVCQAIEDRKEELVCAMYESGSAAQAAQDMSALLQDIILAALSGASEGLVGIVNTIVSSIFTPVFFDDLFRIGMDVAGYSGDCSGCVQNCSFTFNDSVQDWELELVSGQQTNIPPVRWDNTSLGEGAIIFVYDSFVDTGEKHYRATSPEFYCSGNQLAVRIVSNFSSAGTWTFQVTADEGNETFTHDPVNNTTIYFDLEETKSIRGLQIDYVTNAVPNSNFYMGIMQVDFLTV